MKNGAQHVVVSPFIGEKASRMGQQKSLADAPMWSVAQFLEKKARPPGPRQPPKLIPTAGNDAKTPGNFPQAPARKPVVRCDEGLWPWKTSFHQPPRPVLQTAQNLLGRGVVEFQPIMMTTVLRHMIAGILEKISTPGIIHHNNPARLYFGLGSFKTNWPYLSPLFTAVHYDHIESFVRNCAQIIRMFEPGRVFEIKGGQFERDISRDPVVSCRSEDCGSGTLKYTSGAARDFR